MMRCRGYFYLADILNYLHDISHSFVDRPTRILVQISAHIYRHLQIFKDIYNSNLLILLI